MSKSEFPRHLIDEADRLLIQIRAASDQIEALVVRSRDLLLLAKRTVLDNEKFDREMALGETVIRKSDAAIEAEREAQREVERREKAIDEGRVIPRGGSYAADAALRTEERATMQDIAELSGQGDIELAPGITTSEETPQDVIDEYYRGFGEMPAAVEESLPGQAEEVSTGAAEELSPQPVEAAPVDHYDEVDPTVVSDIQQRADEVMAGDEFEQVSGAVENVLEAAAEVSQVAPHPGDASAVETVGMDFSSGPDKSVDVIVQGGKPIAVRESGTDWSIQQRDLDKLAVTARQNANAKEASEFADKVLDLWSTTLLTESQIAKRLATGKALIMTVLEQARIEQDPRVTKKRGVPQPKEHMPLSAAARKIMERPAPVAAARAGVELGDFKPPEATAENLVSSGVCVVDLSLNMIFGKKGTWTTDSSRARTIANLNNGQMYPVSVIQQRCGWRDERELRDAITPMMERLRDIGIIMTSLPTGIVIRVDD